MLDSGSSKHLNKKHILDHHDRKSLTGFNGASARTEGSSYIPIVLQDPKTGNNVKLDIENAEAMSNIQSNIICMGKCPDLDGSLSLVNMDSRWMLSSQEALILSQLI